MTKSCVSGVQLVGFLCAEMSAAFRSRGVSLPPWRTLRSMRSKWCPTASCDVVVAGSRRGSLELPTPGSSAPVLPSATCAATAAAGSDRSIAAAAAKALLLDGSSGSRVSRASLKASVLLPLSGSRGGAEAPHKTAAAPWKVQSGFPLASRPSLLSQQLATAGPAVAEAASPPVGSTAGGAFDMWSHQPKRRASTEHPATEPPVLRSQHQQQIEAMPAIRTVKMSGRTRS